VRVGDDEPASTGPSERPNVTSELWRAIGQSAIGRYSTYVAGLASVMVLARLFTPEHFGAVASVQVIFTFGLLLSESGFGPAIINEDRLRPAERDGVFTITLLVGVSLALLVVAATPLITRFYANDALGLVTPWIALSVATASASVVPIALLQRDRRFVLLGTSDAAAELLGTVASAVLLVTAAAEPLTALAVRLPIRTGVRFAFLYARSGGSEFGRPGLGWNLSGVRRMLRFASAQFGFNVMNFVARNVDTVLVGRFLGAASLGIYDKTYQLMRYPLMLITFAISPAIQPVLRRHAGDLVEVERVHRRLALRLAYAGVAASIVIVLGAAPIVRLLLGPNWDATIPLLRILALAVPLQVVAASSGGFYQAVGRPGVMLVSGALSAGLATTAVVLGIAVGDLTVLVWALVVAIHLSFVQNYALLYARVFRSSILGLARALAGPALIHVATVVAAYVLTGRA
jgi:O-antigen/teichoic acid export membrane protein